MYAYRVQRAGRADVPTRFDLLPDDEIGRTREGFDLGASEDAYDVTRHTAHYLAVVRDDRDRIVGTMISHRVC